MTKHDPPFQDLPVYREEKNTRILPKHFLSGIAMMDIPINNQNSVNAQFWLERIIWKMSIVKPQSTQTSTSASGTSIH